MAYSHASLMSSEQLARALQAQYRGNVARRSGPRPLYQGSTPLVVTVHQLSLAAELRGEGGTRSFQVSLQLADLPPNFR